MILMAYGFATMIDPESQGAAGRFEVAHRMITDGGSPLAFGLLLIGVGLWLAFSTPKSPT